MLSPVTCSLLIFRMCNLWRTTRGDSLVSCSEGGERNGPYGSQDLGIFAKENGGGFLDEIYPKPYASILPLSILPKS